MPRAFQLGCLFLIAGCQAAPENAEQPFAPYTNLQVFPQDVGWSELGEAMLNNLRGLGLRRTAGEGCLHCHVGSLQTPMETWDFASDVKQTKRQARLMMRMVRSINETYLANLEGRDSLETAVTCYTCHKGQINPRSLLAVLDRDFSAGGIERIEQEYRRLRAEYYGRGVYDFGGALTDLGVTLADRGNYDDAIGALELSVEFESESRDAHRWLVRMVMEKAVVEGRVGELRSLWDSLTAVERPEGAIVWFTLRSVGVRMRRTGQLEAAEWAFALNAQIYQNDHRIITDLAQTQLLRGDTASAVALARRALDIDPDYDNAVELLAEVDAER